MFICILLYVSYTYFNTLHHRSKKWCMNKPRRQTKTIFVFVFFQKASSSCPYAAYQPPSVDNEPLYPASRNPECVSIDTTSSTVHFDNTRDQLVTRPTVDLGYDAAGYSTIQSQEDNLTYSNGVHSYTRSDI